MRPALAVGALLAAMLVSACAPAAAGGEQVTVAFRYSRFSPSALEVPVGVPVTFALRNDDPIDHEWIVGTADVHAVHRVGTEPVHEGRANEVSVPAYSTRVTTVTFGRAGTYLFICHLPGHESYGMVGTLRVVSR
ncbi:MAG TPA: cupredoxin domain-containing protein [Candidatus Limnocylindria bacterium]|nr:cupredoxin domain-containing protein [Candidatus Limnocylindria bacterium]